MGLRVFKLGVLIAVWLLWSGVPDAHGEGVPLTVVFGVLSSVGVLVFAGRLARRNLGGPPFAFWFRHVLYLPWLLKEIVLSNLHVAKVVLSPKPLPIRPRVIRVPAPLRTDAARVIYANSITLTPGTITLDVRSDELIVHALTDHTADGLLSGEMGRRVSDLEEGY